MIRNCCHQVGTLGSEIIDEAKGRQISNRTRVFLGLTIYSLAVVAPALIASMTDYQLRVNGVGYWLMATTGMVAFSICSMQVVLASRIPWVEKSFGVKSVFKLHKCMAFAVTVLVVAHIGLLVWSRGWGPVLSPRVSWPLFFGRVCFWSLAFLMVFSLSRRLLPLNQADWRWFHSAIAWVVLVFGFAHSFTIGSSFASLLCSLVWICYFLGAILACLSQVWGDQENEKPEC